MRRLVLTFVIAFAVITSIANNLDGRLTIEVKVKPTKANGKSWDILNGAPDIMIKIYHPDLGEMDSIMFKNSFEAIYVFDIENISGEIEVEIWDRDIIEHDLIGKCKIDIDSPGEYNCGRAIIYVRRD